jgi:hypothetical protein
MLRKLFMALYTDAVMVLGYLTQTLTKIGKTNWIRNFTKIVHVIYYIWEC